MIYKLLLHSSSLIIISDDQFVRKRAKKTRFWRDPQTDQLICEICEESFPSAVEFRSHWMNNCLTIKRSFNWPPKSSAPENLGLGPFPSILAVCRLVHLEAAPLLYRSNQLGFGNATTLSDFRWSTDARLSKYVERLHIRFPLCLEQDLRGSTYTGKDEWWRYTRWRMRHP